MPKCKICLSNFKKLYFDTGRMRICKKCIDTLNNHNGTADDTYKYISNTVLNNIQQEIFKTFKSKDSPEREKNNAKVKLDNIDVIHKSALEKEIYTLIHDQSNKSLTAKIIRAEKKGLLYKETPLKIGYPQSWEKKAKKIRKKDHLQCHICGLSGVKLDANLDVHHIIYVRNFGTHLQNNLVTLCRDCHENEHGVIFSDDSRYDLIEISKDNNVQKNTQIDSNMIKLLDSQSQTDKEVTPKPRPLKNEKKAVKTTDLNKKDISSEIVSSDNQLANGSYDIITEKHQPIPKPERDDLSKSAPQDNPSYWNKYWYIFIVLIAMAFYFFG